MVWLAGVVSSGHSIEEAANSGEEVPEWRLRAWLKNIKKSPSSLRCSLGRQLKGEIIQQWVQSSQSNDRSSQMIKRLYLYSTGQPTRVKRQEPHQKEPNNILTSFTSAVLQSVPAIKDTMTMSLCCY